jgi:hypothetical protein
MSAKVDISMAALDRLGAEINGLASEVEAALVESVSKRVPDPLTKAQIRALVIAGRRGAYPSGQRTGFGITKKTADGLIAIDLLYVCALSGNYYITSDGKRVLDLPRNANRAATMRRLGV